MAGEITIVILFDPVIVRVETIQPRQTIGKRQPPPVNAVAEAVERVIGRKNQRVFRPPERGEPPGGNIERLAPIVDKRLLHLTGEATPFFAGVISILGQLFIEQKIPVHKKVVKRPSHYPAADRFIAGARLLFGGAEILADKTEQPDCAGGQALHAVKRFERKLIAAVIVWAELVMEIIERERLAPHDAVVEEIIFHTTGRKQPLGD